MDVFETARPSKTSVRTMRILISIHKRCYHNLVVFIRGEGGHPTPQLTHFYHHLLPPSSPTLSNSHGGGSSSCCRHRDVFRCVCVLLSTCCCVVTAWCLFSVLDVCSFRFAPVPVHCTLAGLFWVHPVPRLARLPVFRFAFGYTHLMR